MVAEPNINNSRCHADAAGLLQCGLKHGSTTHPGTAATGTAATAAALAAATGVSQDTSADCSELASEKQQLNARGCERAEVFIGGSTSLQT